MDFSKRLSISYYKNIAVLNEAHKVYLVQHQDSKKIFIKKILDVYNTSIYQHLQQYPVEGIPKIIEFYEEHSSLILIEEYISGETLQEKINKGSLTEKNINTYLRDLCQIVTELHSFHPPIIHRDIKPSNIVITPYHHVILLDFNAAKFFTTAKSFDTVLLGTKGYAAPEQYGFGVSTQQTDIYAIGVLLKELTSSLPNPTHAFDSIITKCTQINPFDRFASVETLCEFFESIPMQEKIPSSHTKSKYYMLPPGFRSFTPWHIILALPAYAFIFFVSFTLEVEQMHGPALWVERFFCLLLFLSIIFAGSNYLNIQKLIPLCQNKNRVLHFLGVILLAFLLVCLLLFSMVVMEAFFHLKQV